MTAEDTRQLCLVSLPESLQTHLSGHTMKIANFGLKNLKRYICEKTIVLENVNFSDSCAFYLSRRPWSFKYMMHDSRIMLVKTTEKEHCPDDEKKSVVSVFERTQHSVPLHVFLQSRFEQPRR